MAARPGYWNTIFAAGRCAPNTCTKSLRSRFPPKEKDKYGGQRRLPKFSQSDRNRLIVMERSYAFGVGNTIRLFDVDLSGATNVAQFDSLSGRQYTPAAKKLLFDFASLAVRLDNIEGMTWGPRLPGGKSQPGLRVRRQLQSAADHALPGARSSRALSGRARALRGRKPCPE
jgi:hypothetical protein